MFKSIMDNLLIHVQILAPLNPCGYGGSPTVIPGHEAKPHIYSLRLVIERKAGSETLVREVSFPKRKHLYIICRSYA